MFVYFIVDASQYIYFLNNNVRVLEVRAPCNLKGLLVCMQFSVIVEAPLCFIISC